MEATFEKRVTMARRRSMRRWSRGLRYAGEIGAAITGAVGLWFFAAVMLA